MTPPIEADKAVEHVLTPLHGMPAFLTGSAVAAEVYDKPFMYNDVDVFTPNSGMYFVTIQHLLNNGFELANQREERTWGRHKRYGFIGWHTNSLHLVHSGLRFDMNVIYKNVDGHPTTRLSQVLESFDFGLLATGYDCETGVWHDMREYFFGPFRHYGPFDPLPMLPYREEQVSQGFMSQHIMMRTPGRYARYAHTYGYDLSLIKPVLVEGYNNYADYKSQRTKPEDLTLGSIARALAQHIEDDDFEEITEFAESLPKADSLDVILEGLE